MLYLKRGCTGLLIGLLLEILVFNFGFLTMLMEPSLQERVLRMEDFEATNWSEYEGRLISQPDPMFVAYQLQGKVKTAAIYYETAQQPDSITLYYTNSRYPIVCEETTRRTQSNPNQRVEITINDEIQVLRVDIGESAGLELTDFRVVFNEREFDFSVSRIMTMVLIWLVGTFLFGMQKMPDYHLERFYNPSDGEDPEDQAKKPHQCQ